MSGAKRRLLLGTVLTPFLYFGVPGGVIESAVAAIVHDPLAVLAARSPGERPAGALTQTKPRRKDARSIPLVARDPGVAPVERVLSETRTRPELPYVPGLSGPDVATDIPVAALVANAPVSGAPIGSGGIPVVPVGIGGGATGGGGGVLPTPSPTPTPGAAPTPTPTPGTSPTSPVPEPATWLAMIAGMGLIGTMLRRRQRPATLPSLPTVGGR